MCGIIGYLGPNAALPVLLKGLDHLQYRGYDSAGIALHHRDGIVRVRSVGKVADLSAKAAGEHAPTDATLGVAHTRWATHGAPVETNAHPHADCTGRLAVVHNGIIENYRELRDELSDTHTFTSQTDSEVLAHLIEAHYTGDLAEAVRASLVRLRGTYGIAVIHADHPDLLVAARFGNPVAIGIGTDAYFVASDATPMLTHTRRIVFLDDGELAAIRRTGWEVFDVKGVAVPKTVESVEWDEQQAQKHGHPHFMIKEIMEQPMALADALRRHLSPTDDTVLVDGLDISDQAFRDIRRVVLLACGTAYYASIFGSYAFERLARVPADAYIASEFRYRSSIVDDATLVLALSQSGETADTIAAIRDAKTHGAEVRAILNANGSSMSRLAHGCAYLMAGPELSVCSTKAYTNMLVLAVLHAIRMGAARGVDPDVGREIVRELRTLPDKMARVLELNDHVRNVAAKYAHYNDFLYLGRGVNVPVAYEGALKLKEVSYVHSEAVPAGEMKHGINALLGEDFPVMGLMTRNSLYDKMRNNIEEVRARGSKVLLVATEGDDIPSSLADDVFYVPQTLELLEPILNTIPLQLFAYHVAVHLGRDVDRPRNLAKSVTVE